MANVVKANLSNNKISSNEATYKYTEKPVKVELSNNDATYDMQDYTYTADVQNAPIENATGVTTSIFGTYLDPSEPEVYIDANGMARYGGRNGDGYWVNTHVIQESDGAEIPVFVSIQLPEGAVAQDGGYTDKDGIFHTYQELYDNAKYQLPLLSGMFVREDGTFGDIDSMDGIAGEGISTIVSSEQNGQQVDTRVAFELPDGSTEYPRGYVDKDGVPHRYQDLYDEAMKSYKDTGAVSTSEAKSNIFTRAWDKVKDTGAKIADKIKSIFGKKDKPIEVTKANPHNWTKKLEYAKSSPGEIHYSENGERYVQKSVEYYYDEDGKQLGYRVGEVYCKTGETVNGDHYIEGYYHYDRDTETISPISVQNAGQQMLPDLANKGSDKYSQRVEQLQRDFPVSSFEKVTDANDFYNNYMETMDNSRQDYAALSDSIFWHYTGREDEFQETFGFPMYTVNENEGRVNYNYEDMGYSIFNYMNGDKIKQDMASGKIYSDRFGIHNSKDGSRYDASVNEIDQKQIEGYLASYGIDADVNLHPISKIDKYTGINNQGNSVILDSKKYTVYDKKGNARQIEKSKGVDTMSVVGVDDEGYIIVNRYGVKEKVDPSSFSSDFVTIEFND